jgi:flagellar hook-associated protein 2
MCAISLNLTGLDTETIIQQMMVIERQPLLKLQSQQAVLAKKKQAWDSIRTRMGTVASRLSSLANLSTLNQKTVSSSNTSVASATASSSAVAGVYDLRVSSLASSQVVASSLRDSLDSALGMSGTLNLNGKTLTVAITDSLSSIAAKINATEGIGAKASVLQTEPSKYSLILTSEESGTANRMVLEDGTASWQDLGVVDGSGVINEIQAASNAVFSVNGVQFTRSSNVVSDAIPGITMTLMQAASAETGLGGTSSLTVGNDDQAVIDCVKQFVVDYNTLLETIKTYNSWDPDTKVAGTLFGDPLLQRLLVALRETIFRSVDGAIGGYRSMSSIGLSTGALGAYSRDGKLSLDESKLREALKENRDAVMVLFGAQTSNAALASRGATVTASSTFGPEYSPEGVIDGSTSTALWGANGGWSDGTAGDFPDYLEIDFGAMRTIDTINVRTMDSPAMPASTYGISDFNAEYWDEGTGSWVNLFTVSGNTQGNISNSFSPVSTSKIRINVTGSNDGQYSRILEVEAKDKNDGIFTSLQSVIQTYTSADGLLLGRTSEIDKLDKDLSRQIENMQRRLDMRLDSLKKKFTALEIMLQQFNAQSAWMAQQIESISRQNR